MRSTPSRQLPDRRCTGEPKTARWALLLFHLPSSFHELPSTGPPQAAELTAAQQEVADLERRLFGSPAPGTPQASQERQLVLLDALCAMEAPGSSEEGEGSEEGSAHQVRASAAHQDIRAARKGRQLLKGSQLPNRTAAAQQGASCTEHAVGACSWLPTRNMGTAHRSGMLALWAEVLIRFSSFCIFVRLLPPSRRACAAWPRCACCAWCPPSASRCCLAASQRCVAVAAPEWCSA